MKDMRRAATMDKMYTYYAFISYNHLDEKWAKRLQHKLHHYRLPSIARKEIGADMGICHTQRSLE